jgi:DNA (cytosine-5)-methyltransferase 1
MKFGSLFAGIGGLDLGLERAGMECVWQVENDPYATRVLDKHWPDVRRYGDIKKINWEEVERPTLVCGGFPCQPVSIAGRQLGAADERWLWPEFERCLCDVRPRYVLIENVPGLLTNGGSGVIEEAAAVGAPHLRYRIFIIGYTDRGSKPALSVNDEASRLQSMVADANVKGLEGRVSEVLQKRTGELPPWKVGSPGTERGHWWVTEPRLRCLGNAVVPQVAEWVGRRIMEHDRRI